MISGAAGAGSTIFLPHIRHSRQTHPVGARIFGMRMRLYAVAVNIPLREAASAMSGLAQAAHRLHPAEGFFDALALDRADSIAGMASCARIDRRAAVGVVLGDVWRAAAFATAGDEFSRIIVLVAADGASGSGVVVNHVERGRALGRAIGLGEPASYQEWDTAIGLARRHAFGFMPEPTFVYDCTGNDTISKDLTRVAMGYEYVVNKHRSEIFWRLGPRAIAQHLETIARFYVEASASELAAKAKLKSLLWWPSPRRVIRTGGLLRISAPYEGDVHSGFADYILVGVASARIE